MDPACVPGTEIAGAAWVRQVDEVAAELGRTLDVVKVPRREKEEVLAAFAAHKNEVTAGHMSVN
jgi:hypothetical protein